VRKAALEHFELTLAVLTNARFIVWERDTKTIVNQL
jgi:hypothetical protein